MKKILFVYSDTWMIIGADTPENREIFAEEDQAVRGILLDLAWESDFHLAEWMKKNGLAVSKPVELFK